MANGNFPMKRNNSEMYQICLFYSFCIIKPIFGLIIDVILFIMAS
jgi:hypothetical protein